MADFSMQTGPKSKLIAAPHVLTLRLLSAVESNIMWIFLKLLLFLSEHGKR